MKWHGRQTWLLAATLVAIAAAAGCTGTDVLDNGTFEVRFGFGSTNPSGTDYDCILLDFNGGDAGPSLTIRPVDGTCSGGANAGLPCGLSADCPGGECDGNLSEEVIGGAGFQVTINPLNDANFAPGRVGDPCVAKYCSDQSAGLVSCEDDGDCPGAQNVCQALISTSGGTLPRITLSEGKYIIDKLRVTDPRMVDVSGNLSSCAGGDDITPGYTDAQLRFDVGSGQPNRVEFVMNINNVENVIGNPLGCGTLADGPGFFYGDIANMLEIRN